MKALDLRKKTEKELRGILGELEIKRDSFRFETNRKKVKNVKEFREIRRDVARVLTILNQK